MSETALAALFPELDALVGDWRRRYTPDGARDMPPHVMLVYPFVESARVPDALPGVGRSLDGVAQFEVAFAEIVTFSGAEPTLYLRPDPGRPFVAMTEALIRAFPDR